MKLADPASVAERLASALRGSTSYAPLARWRSAPIRACSSPTDWSRSTAAQSSRPPVRSPPCRARPMPTARRFPPSPPPRAARRCIYRRKRSRAPQAPHLERRPCWQVRSTAGAVIDAVRLPAPGGGMAPGRPDAAKRRRRRHSERCRTRPCRNGSIPRRRPRRTGPALRRYGRRIASPSARPRRRRSAKRCRFARRYRLPVPTSRPRRDGGGLCALEGRTPGQVPCRSSCDVSQAGRRGG